MITKVTKTHIVCPSCNKPAGTIDHFLEFTYPVDTRWYCDHCREQYSFVVTKQNNELVVSDLKLTGNKMGKCLVLLKNNDIGLVVEGLYFNNEFDSNHEYFYNEHTCPVNYLKDIKEIFDLKNKDYDPHGIFQYVTTLPYDSRIDDSNNDEFKTELMKKYER